MNGQELLRRAHAMENELFEVRRRIHACPELGNQEYKTAGLVEDYLRGCGIETSRPLPTAVVGVLRGGLPGTAAALRADMDALPIREATGVPYASRCPGVMHACGHDFHTTAALGAAKLLSQMRESLPGTVKFFFQPDEEGRGGAARMMEAGCMDAPEVTAVFGAHVDPNLPAGTIGVREGKFYAAADVFDVVIHGKSAHGAQPELGIDALYAAADTVCALHQLTARFPDERTVLAIGTFSSGAARNIIADRAEFAGILRTLGPDARAAMKEALLRTIEETAARHGARAETAIRTSYPGVVNHAGAAALVRRTAAALLGDGRLADIQQPTMTTEDFGCFGARAPIAFYHIGVGGDYSLHTPGFLPPESLLPDAAALHAAVLAAYLADPAAIL